MDSSASPRRAAASRTIRTSSPGGMRQRAMIAITLASNPKLLLADEPTTALERHHPGSDPEAHPRTPPRTQHVVLFVDARSRRSIAAVCDRLAVMYAGRIVEVARSRPSFSIHIHRLYARASRLGAAARARETHDAPGSIEGPPAAEPCRHSVRDAPFHAALRVRLGDMPDQREPVLDEFASGRLVCLSQPPYRQGVRRRSPIPISRTPNVPDSPPKTSRGLPVATGYRQPAARPSAARRACPQWGFLSRLNRGETLGIVGESGCGKVDPCALSVRLLDCGQGRGCCSKARTSQGFRRSAIESFSNRPRPDDLPGSLFSLNPRIDGAAGARRSPERP